MTIAMLLKFHLICVALSVSLFVVRYWWRYCDHALAAARWTRIAPPVIDTLLLLSGIGLIVNTHILPFTESGSWLTEKLFGVIIYTQNHSSCIKAASERAPRSVQKYVTGVSKRSQHRCGLKDDVYTSFWVLLRLIIVRRAVSRRVLSLSRWRWWCCTSSLNSPPQKYRYWGKS